jgi:hypothetical protein
MAETDDATMSAKTRFVKIIGEFCALSSRSARSTPRLDVLALLAI